MQAMQGKGDFNVHQNALAIHMTWLLEPQFLTWYVCQKMDSQHSLKQEIARTSIIPASLGLLLSFEP